MKYNIYLNWIDYNDNTNENKYQLFLQFENDTLNPPNEFGHYICTTYKKANIVLDIKDYQPRVDAFLVWFKSIYRYAIPETK